MSTKLKDIPFGNEVIAYDSNANGFVMNGALYFENGCCYAPIITIENGEAVFQGHVNCAEYACCATNADYATNAQNADYAGYACCAGGASWADCAGWATGAEAACCANNAYNADYAGYAFCAGCAAQAESACWANSVLDNGCSIYDCGRVWLAFAPVADLPCGAKVAYYV